MKAEGSDDVIDVTDDREEAIATAIMLCRRDAIHDDEAYETVVCVGAPCRGFRDGCQMCERIVCLPNAQVIRDLVRH